MLPLEPDHLKVQLQEFVNSTLAIHSSVSNERVAQKNIRDIK